MNWIRWALIILLLPALNCKGIAQKRSIKSGGSKSLPYSKSYAHPLYSNFSLLLSSGFSAYSGELSKPTDSNLQPYYNNPSLGLGLYYQWTHFISWELRAGWQRIRSTTYPDNWANRVFQLDGFGTEVRFEHTLFPQQAIEGIYKKWNPYIALGAGIFRFEGEARDDLNDSWTYDGGSSHFLFGVGFRFYMNERLSFGLAGIYHQLQTDLLDDTNFPLDWGNPNDGYFNYSLCLKYQLKKSFNYKHYLKRIGSS